MARSSREFVVFRIDDINEDVQDVRCVVQLQTATKVCRREPPAWMKLLERPAAVTVIRCEPALRVTGFAVAN